jgi:dipeptidase D
MGCEVGIFRFLSGLDTKFNSEILDVLVPIYENKRRKTKVVACHAGLECGILGTNYPDMDMISLTNDSRCTFPLEERSSENAHINTTHTQLCHGKNWLNHLLH